jgi:hypothetical protein
MTLDIRRILADADALLTREQRVRIALARARRILAKENPCHEPGGSSEGGQFCETGGEGGGGEAKPEAAKPITPGLDSPTLTPKEQETITYYQGDKGYIAINESLRKGNAPGEHAKRLDSAIAKFKSAGELKVYRGIGNTLTRQLKDAVRDREEGDPPITFVDKGFVSSSTSKKVAEKFSKNTITLTIHEGANMLPIADREHANEHEVLLPRGTKFQIDHVRKTAAGWRHFDVSIVQ